MMQEEARPWSCDSFAVAATHTLSGATLLGKNSDRPARESQPLHRYGARTGAGRLRLAYVEIDDVSETVPHVGSSPYWCWGHEMGVNAHGVAIGNEALFTRDWARAVQAEQDGHPQPVGILGMELLRLALERSDSARSAVQIITNLVEQYGQWGAGVVGMDRAEGAYDNSYLIADATEIWVVETTGKHWVTRRADGPSCSISNEPTIRTDWEGNSEGLRDHLVDRGWWTAGEPIDFASAVADPGTPLQVSHLRLQRSRQMLHHATTSGRVGFTEARSVLADHYEDTFLNGPTFNPIRPDFLTLCMHEHPSGFTWGNTAASMVATLPVDGRPFLWWGATTPCTSLYIPVAVTGSQLPLSLSTAGTANGAGPNPEKASADTGKTGSYWWIFQSLLETVAGDDQGNSYSQRQPIVRAAFDELQGDWHNAVDGLISGNAPDDEWDALTVRCVDQATDTAQSLLSQFSG